MEGGGVHWEEESEEEKEAGEAHNDGLALIAMVDPQMARRHDIFDEI